MKVSGILAATLTVLASASAQSDPGREFYAVYTYPEGLRAPLTVVACNPDPLGPASVVVDTELGMVGSVVVPPGACEIVLETDQRKATTTIEGQLAYRIRSDRPVLAQQYSDFGLLQGTPSASRLPDRTDFGTDYLVLAMTAGSRSGMFREPSLFVVIAPEAARVSVTVTSDTEAGGAVPALAAGDTYTTDLPPFGVLQIASTADGDLTGSVIRSDVPVEVLAGCLRCFVPTSSTSDDELETIPPEGSWATRYVVPATYPTTSATNLVRILARDDGTVITTEPAQPGTPATLDRGQHLDLMTTADFVVSASGPVLTGRIDGKAFGYGDPGLVLLLGEEQFFAEATFSLPDEGSSPEQWVDIVAYEGATVVVDGMVVAASSLIPVGASGFVHASLPLVFGRTHTVSGDRPLAAYASARSGYNGSSYTVDVGCQAPIPSEVSRPAAPLWLAKRGPDVLFSWADLGLAGGFYNLYAGSIRSIWNHTGLDCGVNGKPAPGGRREVVLPVPPDSSYFLVSAASCGGEGESGGDPASSDCAP